MSEMSFLFNPEISSKEILTKLIHSTLEPTLLNISYVFNFVNSLHYGLYDLSDEAIDFWISLLPHLRDIYLKKEKELGINTMESVFYLCYVCTQIMLICAKRNKKIPNLISVLDGTIQNLPIPKKIIEFPLCPAVTSTRFFTRYYTRFKSLHNFQIPSFQTIVHYSFVLSILFLEQNHEDCSIFDEFKQHSDYNFSIQSENASLENLPSINDPFAFIFLRAILEEMFSYFVTPPITIINTTQTIVQSILESSQELDLKKFYNILVYVSFETIPIPYKLLNTNYSSLLYLMLLSYCFTNTINFEPGEIFHFSSHFWMYFGYFEEIDNTPLLDLIHSQMKSLFSIAAYVIDNVKPAPIDILLDETSSLECKLDVLGSVDVDSIPKENKESFADFWFYHCKQVLSEIRTSTLLPTDQILVNIFSVYNAWIRFQVQFKLNKPFLPSFMNQDVDLGEILAPKSYPYRKLTYQPVLSAFKDIQFAPIANTLDFCAYLSVVTFLERYHDPISLVPELTVEYKETITVDHLIYRYFYEKVFGISMMRTMKENLYTNLLGQEELNEAEIFKEVFLYDSKEKILPNEKIFSKKNVFYGLYASHAFSPQLFDKSIQSSLTINTQCQSELESLLIRSFYNDSKSSIELLKHKECLQYLNPHSKSHLFLSILLSDQDQTFDETLNDPHITAAKLFTCYKSKTKPPSSTVHRNYLNAFHTMFYSRMIFQQPAYSCGLLTVNTTKILKEPEDFFSNNDELSHWQTVLFYLLQLFPPESHPEFINYYQDFAISGYVNNEIKAILGKPSEDKALLWFLFILNTIIDDNLCSLQPVLPDSYLFPMFEFYLINKNDSMLHRILETFFSSTTIDLVNDYYLEKAFQLFVGKNSDGFQILVDYLYQNKVDFLITIMGFIFNDYPSFALLIFNRLVITTELAIQIISNLPTLRKPLSKDAIFILQRVICMLPGSYLDNTPHNIEPLNVEWAEDEKMKVEKSIPDDTINIWQKEELECLKDNHNQPHAAFYCHTCNMRNAYICAACIDSCHQDHIFSYVKHTTFTCACNQNNCCAFCNHPESQEGEGKETMPTAPTSKLLNILECLSEVESTKISKPASTAITKRYSAAVASIGFKRFDCHTVPASVLLSPVKEKLVDVKNLRISKNHLTSFYKKRSASIPFRFAEHHSHFFYVAYGKELRIFRDSSFELIKTVQLPNNIVSVKKAKVNNDYLVLVALESANVLNTHTNSIIYDSQIALGKEDYILQAEMQMKDKITIVTKYHVAVYNIITKTEVESYRSREAITSAVFVHYNDQPYGIFALTSGNLALQSFGLERKSHLTHFSKYRSTYVSIFISYCEETHLFFLAAPATSLQYCHIENIFADNPRNLSQFHSDSIPGEIVFYDTYPNVPSYLLFIQPSTSSLYSIEFTDEFAEMASISDNKNSQLRLFEMNLNLYATIKTPTTIYAINSIGDLMQFERYSQISIKTEYRVPATFYSHCEVASKSQAEIKGTDSSQNYNTLFSDSVAFFHTSVPKKIMTLILKDSSYSIVGFMLSFGYHGISHRPSHISVFNRKYSSQGEYNVMVPLKPNEVDPGKPLNIIFANNAPAEIAMQGIRIFIIKTEKILPFLTQTDYSFSTIGPTYGFLDFVDSDFEPQEGEDDTLFNLAISIEPIPDEVIDEQFFVTVVDVMYQIPKASPFARSAIIRVVQVKKEMTKLWAQELAKLIQNKNIEDSLWPLAWRDFNTIPAEYIGPIKEVLWDSNPKIGSADSIISAFTFM